jgi:hypothetical protein
MSAGTMTTRQTVMPINGNSCAAHACRRADEQLEHSGGAHRRRLAFKCAGAECPSPPPPLPPSLPPLPSLAAKRSPSIQLGGLGSAVSSPSGLWGEAPAENAF